MEIMKITLIAIAWYSIVGTCIGCGLIALYFYLKYIKNHCVKKILIIGIVLVGITVLIFLGFLIFGFWGLGLAQN